MSVFEAGKATAAGEIVEESFPLPGVTVRARTRYAEGAAPEVFEEVPVWLSRDQAEDGAHPAWLGRHITKHYDEAEKKDVFVDHGPIFLLNAARLENQTGIARIMQSAIKGYCVPFEEAKRIVSAAAEAVGIQEAEAEVFEATLLDAAADVQNAAESAKQKMLTVAREKVLALAMAASDPVSDTDPAPPPASSPAAPPSPGE